MPIFKILNILNVVFYQMKKNKLTVASITINILYMPLPDLLTKYRHRLLINQNQSAATTMLVCTS